MLCSCYNLLLRLLSKIIWRILLSDESIIKLPDASSPQMEEMLNYEDMAQKFVSSEILNRKLISIINRVFRWDAETNLGKQSLIAEYQLLMGGAQKENENAE